MKRNFSSLIMMLGGIGIVFYGIFSGGGNIMMFIDIPSLLIVLVGSFCALGIVYPFKDLKNIPKLFNAMLSESTYHLKDLPGIFEELGAQARRDGVLALEGKLDSLENDFIRRGIQMVIDGSEGEEIRNILETEIAALESRHAVNHAMIGKWSSLAPGFGMIGTVLGLIIMLGDLGGDAASLGAGMAVALITTFYGSFFQNLIFEPLQENLRKKTTQEVLFREVIVEGVIMVQNGSNPRAIKELLMTYLSPVERLEIEKQDADA